jgi:VanZ family protein
MNDATTVDRREDSKAHRGSDLLRRYLPLLIWMSVIFFASTGELSASNTIHVLEPLLRWLFPAISRQRINEIHFLIRKAAHFTEYAILAWLAARAFVRSTHRSVRIHWLLSALLLVCVYALLDEYHQSFVPSRTASIYDSMIDMSGGLTILVLLAIWRTIREKRSRSGEGVVAGTEPA